MSINYYKNKRYNDIASYSYIKTFFIKDGGFWVKLEVLNIPWNESLLDFNTEYFDKAKLLIEKTVSKYIKFYYL